MEYKIINKKQVISRLNKLFKEEEDYFLNSKIIDILNQFIWTLGFNDIHMLLNRLKDKEVIIFEKNKIEGLNKSEEIIRTVHRGYQKRKDLTEQELKQLEQTEKDCSDLSQEESALINKEMSQK